MIFASIAEIVGLKSDGIPLYILFLSIYDMNIIMNLDFLCKQNQNSMIY